MPCSFATTPAAMQEYERYREPIITATWKHHFTQKRFMMTSHILSRLPRDMLSNALPVCGIST
jgi:hypothetical protein